MKMIYTKSIVLMLIGFTYSISCSAQWSIDPNVDNSLNATLAVSGPNEAYCTDGHGGAIYSWMTNGTKGVQVYANRIDSLGNIRWGSSGVLLCPDSVSGGGAPNPSICEDGIGGCYVAFSIGASSQPIICHHLDSNGNILWGPQGKLITNTFPSQFYQAYPSLVNDGGNGVFITFYDNNNQGPNPGLYAQRLGFDGSMQWGNYGVAIELAADIRQPKAIADGQNGIAVAWADYSITPSYYQLRMNRLDHNGQLQFTAGSEKINTIQGLGYGPFFRLMLSTQKNYIAVWTSDAFGYPTIFSQKIDPQGNFLWGSSEIKVRDTTGESDYPDLISDGNDGAYYVWLDARKVNIATGIFAQYINGAGSKVWISQGLQIDSNANGLSSPHIAPDANNGMKIFWTNELTNRVYMQQLNQNGIAQLAGIGTAVGAIGHISTFYEQVLPASNNHDIIFLHFASPATVYAKFVPFNSVLPLNIISFNGVNKGAINLLTWETSSEINTSYFSIERGDEGNHFAEIGKIAAKNGAQINNYNYEDAATSNNVVYYRLKETDKDGKVTFSNIIDIHQTLTSALHIFPNPAKTTCAIYFNSMADRNSVLKIFDLNGKQQKQILIKAGQSSVTIDVSSFSAGTYFCRLEVAGKMFTQKLMVVK
jgi:hypothetical protein